MADKFSVIPPSPPGPSFASADVTQADIAAAGDISQAQAASIILQATNGGQGVQNDQSGVIALLAAILRNQKRNNANYTPMPFSFGAYIQQQLVGADPLRNYLLIQNVGSGDLMVLFETSSVNAQDFSSATAVLTTKQTRCVRIVAGGYYEPLVAPTNAISLFTLGTGTNGLFVAGS